MSKSSYKDVQNNSLPKVVVEVVEARNLIAADSNGLSDPFCVVKLNKEVKTKKVTHIQMENLYPKWNETFTFYVEEPQTDRLKFEVWDYDKYSTNDFLGQCTVPVMAVVNRNEPLDEWFSLLDKRASSKANSKKERGEIHLIITYYPPESEQLVRATSSGNSQSTDRNWETDYESLHLELELGRGAFGIVYRGKWRFQDVAVKLLLNQKMSEKELTDFRAECQIMMSLRPHRNVVPLMGVCTDPQKPLCIVTDFVENGSLERLIKSNYVIPWKMVVDIAKGITAGVYHLHLENILHRDLAARNILLRSNFEPLIADFGLSKKVQIDLKDQKSKGEIQTKEKEAFRGPYKWMPWESLSRNEFSIKSDAYSFGVVLYEIIARQEPFPQYDIYQVAHLVTTQNMTLIPPPNAPAKFVQLMRWCWQRDPADRPDFKQISEKLVEIEREIHLY